jgi:hypothetical protein
MSVFEPWDHAVRKLQRCNASRGGKQLVVSDHASKVVVLYAKHYAAPDGFLE